VAALSTRIAPLECCGFLGLDAWGFPFKHRQAGANPWSVDPEPLGDILAKTKYISFYLVRTTAIKFRTNWGNISQHLDLVCWEYGYKHFQISFRAKVRILKTTRRLVSWWIRFYLLPLYDRIPAAAFWSSSPPLIRSNHCVIVSVYLHIPVISLWMTYRIQCKMSNIVAVPSINHHNLPPLVRGKASPALSSWSLRGVC
jgi:hypothetical protein